MIIFIPRKRMVREVEKLFQVSATFLLTPPMRAARRRRAGRPLVVLFALLMLVPLAFAWRGHDGAERAFAASAFVVTAGAGLLMQPG